MPFSARVVGLLGGLFLASFASITQAQSMPAHEHDSPVPRAGWLWTTDGNVIAGYNYQQRQFLDYSAWESQNWFMVAGARRLGAGELTIDTMFSLERFTLPRQGSPQLFQTGESYNRIPLVNYQHPHDLVMGLGATYRLAHRGVRYALGADLVGSPTLGPVPFMHRSSARDNPQVPISHHMLDSTHITPGVVRVAAEFRGLTLESSVFRGAEPDEQRLDLERPALDSWALRAQFVRGPWSAQLSGGHIKQPEWWEPFDESRITASLSFDGTIHSRPAAVTFAWGGNREFNGFNGNADGYLLEANVRVSSRSTIFGRAEIADKELYGAGPHTLLDRHPHAIFQVGAATVGYVRELSVSRLGSVGAGADIVLYDMPDAIDQFWAGSHSFHAFLRWHPPSRTAGHQH